MATTDATLVPDGWETLDTLEAGVADDDSHYDTKMSGCIFNRRLMPTSDPLVLTERIFRLWSADDEHIDEAMRTVIVLEANRAAIAAYRETSVERSMIKVD